MNLDRFIELAETLRTAKLRTALTAFSVAWGIFMLVILLGAGAGIQNGAEHQFRDDAANSVWIYPGTTSIPFEGYKIGRNVRLSDDDYDAIQHDIEGVEHITGRFYLQGQYTVSYGGEISTFDIRACHPGHQWIEKTIITAGRFINELDLAERRKVAIIGPIVVDRLFHGEDPLGKWIKIRNMMVRVVGVFDDEGGERELAKIYIPISTAQTAFGDAHRIHQIMFTVDENVDVDQSKVIADRTTRLLAGRHQFASTDKRALRVNNNFEEFYRIVLLFQRIRSFIWLVGVGTIVAGIVGVSNIMLISVRERMKEIGIRKALGATPWAILSQILIETFIVTGISGYAGLLAGVGVVELVRKNVPPTDFFRNPTVNFEVVVGATVLLIFSSMLAGFFPARFAAKVNPVVALRAE